MFPFCFDWVSDPVHFVFMGSLYSVLILLGIFVNYAVIRAFLDLICKKEEHGNH